MCTCIRLRNHCSESYVCIANLLSWTTISIHAKRTFDFHMQWFSWHPPWAMQLIFLIIQQCILAFDHNPSCKVTCKSSRSQPYMGLVSLTYIWAQYRPMVTGVWLSVRLGKSNSPLIYWPTLNRGKIWNWLSTPISHIYIYIYVTSRRGRWVKVLDHRTRVVGSPPPNGPISHLWLNTGLDRG